MQTSETPLAKRRQQQLLQQATQLQGAVPPSTAIRSRFLTITEQPAARGTKRRLDAASTGSSPGIRSPAPWMLGLGPGLDTPVRARPAQATASLLDSLLQSPSRSILAAVQRDSSAASQANALRRAAEDARFDAQQAALERERERSEAVQLRQALEAEVAAQAKRVEALERDRRWLFEQEEKLTCARRGAEAALARQRAAYEARVDQMDAAVRDADRRLDDVARAMRRQAAEHASEKEALLLRATRAEREKESLMQSQAAREEGLLQSQAAREESLMQSQAAREESLMRSQAAGEESLMQSQAAGGESLMQSQAAGGDAMPIRESKRDPPSLIAQLERDLAEQCAYIKAVEQQNRHLRAEAKRLAQAAAAQEQEREAAQALRAKVQRLEDAQRAHAETAAQLSALQQERAQWQRVFEAPGAPNAGSPFAVARTVADQRHALRALETRAAALQAACAESEQHRVSAETRCEALAAECARLRAQADAEAQRAARLDGARLHAVREADFARAQLHSYDREEASMMPGNYDAHKALRIRQLEMFVDELRAWVAAADSGADADPARTNAVNAASAELLRGYREDAESARDDYRRLLERFEALEREAARLELQVGAGLGCDPRTTRILQLADNPAARDFAIRSARLKALAAENAALLERLRGLEKGAGADPADDAAAAPADDATAAPFFRSIDNLRSENRRLADQLDVSAKMISRLKKEWKRKASELRDAIYSILGYRIDFLPNGSVRLTSMYAADVDQSFVFTSGDADQGIMHLSGGGSKLYLKSLANDIRFWLQERGSIPAFMATVTLQSFEEAQSKTAPE